MKKRLRQIFWTLLAVAAMASLTGCGSALIRAAQQGDVPAMEKLLDQGADINEFSLGSPPLHMAAKRGDVHMASFLLDRGADIDIKTFGGRTGGPTPLVQSSENGHVAVSELLIERGADTNYAIAELTNISNLYIGGTRANALRGIKIIEDIIEKSSKTARMEASDETVKKSIAIKNIQSDIDQIPAVKSRLNKNAFAIVIGIERYRQKLPTADFASKDAKVVTSYLTKTMGYPEENVVTLLNDRATNVDLVKYLEKWLPNNVEPDSTVFVYFSGHGAPDPKTGSAYLVPYDGDPTFIAETGYSLSRMYAALGKLPAKEVIVALDSCFSGAGGRSVLAKGARPLVMNLQTGTAISKNMTVLSASAGDQISSTYDEKGHGLFTYFLLKGIKNEDVLNPDGSLHMEDLYGYLKPQVERIARKQYNNEQTPQLMEGR